MRILCTGVNHKTADVALRERLAFDHAATGRGLRELTRRWPAAEFVILSTCNRTEIYAVRALHGRPREQELLAWLGEFHGLETRAFDEAAYTLADAGAVRHLLAVTSGLDSLVFGEAQITAQVKDAYAAARRAGTAGSIMNELFQAALHVAKRVRTETDVAAGKVSVASVAIDCVTQSLDTLADKCVLNVGAGEMNELMLRRLVTLGAGRILVANRSPERAAALAEQFGGEAVEFSALGEHLAAADVVLTSTASDAPIITRKMVADARARRGGRPLLILDIAVPRDVEPDAGEIDDVRLLNIDELDQIVSAGFTGRHRRRVAAEAIVARHVAKILRGLNIRDVAPTIDAMHQRFRGIADEELAAAVNKFREHDDADADTEILNRALHRTIRRILHPVARNLRKAAGSDAARAHIAALWKLFELDEE